MDQWSIYRSSMMIHQSIDHIDRSWFWIDRLIDGINRSINWSMIIDWGQSIDQYWLTLDFDRSIDPVDNCWSIDRSTIDRSIDRSSMMIDQSTDRGSTDRSIDWSSIDWSIINWINRSIDPGSINRLDYLLDWSIDRSTINHPGNWSVHQSITWWINFMD